MIKQFYLPIDETLTGATTLNISGHRSNGNKGVRCIPQRFRTNRFSLVSYQRYTL